MILSIHDARLLVEDCMPATGHTQTESATIADHLIDCELRGLSFGGLPRALSVIDHLRDMKTPRRPITVLKKRLGELLPEGLAFDSAGQPTRDPDAALKGAFTVSGGHKGSGLAMVVQLLAMMTGQATAPASLADCGFFIVVVDPALLTSPKDYLQRVSQYAESIRATRPLKPDEPVRVPFDRSVVEREKRIAADAIEVPDSIHAALLEVAGSAVPS